MLLYSGDQWDPKTGAPLSTLFKFIIFQGRGHRVCAVVMRTGFCTVKGNLVRSIMFPAPVDFKFENDSYKFIGILSIIAVFGFIYTCTVQVKTLGFLINIQWGSEIRMCPDFEWSTLSGFRMAISLDCFIYNNNLFFKNTMVQAKPFEIRTFWTPFCKSKFFFYKTVQASLAIRKPNFLDAILSKSSVFEW